MGPEKIKSAEVVSAIVNVSVTVDGKDNEESVLSTINAVSPILPIIVMKLFVLSNTFAVSLTTLTPEKILLTLSAAFAVSLTTPIRKRKFATAAEAVIVSATLPEVVSKDKTESVDDTDSDIETPYTLPAREANGASAKAA